LMVFCLISDAKGKGVSGKGKGVRGKGLVS